MDKLLQEGVKIFTTRDTKKIARYRTYLKDVALRYPYVQELMEQYPRLDKIMVNNAFVREILLTKVKDEKMVRIIPDYLTRMADSIAKRFAEDKREKELRMEDMPIEEIYEGLYGDKAIEERIDSQYDLLVVFFESDILYSTMPERFYEQEIGNVQSILGYRELANEEAQKLLSGSGLSYSYLNVELIQDTDKILVSGHEREMIDQAIANEDNDAIDYIIATKALQKYLFYLQDGVVRYSTKEKGEEDSEVVIPPPDPKRKLVLKPLEGDEGGEKLRLRIARCYELLAPFVDANLKQFTAIFIGDEQLTQKVKWKRDMKELQYVVCLLSGIPFKEKDKVTGAYVETVKDTGRNILVDKSEPWACAANCFLNKYGKSFTNGGISTPNAVKHIPEDQRQILNKAINILK